MGAAELLNTVFGNMLLPGNHPTNQRFQPAVFEKKIADWLPFIEEFLTNTVVDNCERVGDVKDKPLILLSVDLSGIQDTVYTISSKGALKSLRARSFMLELLCEHICYELVTNLLGSFKDYRCHVMFSGGGGGTIVLPNKEGTEDEIDSFFRALNDWAFEEFYGKLFIAHAFLAVPSSKLPDFSETWKQVGDLLKLKKQQKFDYKLEEIFSRAGVVEPMQKKTKEECQICHRDNIEIGSAPFYCLGEHKKTIRNSKALTAIADDDDKTIVHELCYNLYQLGDELLDLEYKSIIRSSKPPKEAYVKFPVFNGNQFAYYFISGSTEKAEFQWQVNKPGANPFLYAYYARKVGDLSEAARKAELDSIGSSSADRTASMAGLAAATCGADFICALRMDVDNMGRIFSTDLQPFTPDNYARLSRLLNWFFKVFLNDLCACDNLPDGLELNNIIPEIDYKSKGRDVSITYAGGDDLFIVGAWNQIIELAYDIQSAFEKFSGLGISGGCTLHQDNYPLYQMARMSGFAEEASKIFVDWQAKKNNEDPTKNRFTIFYSPFYEQKNEQLNMEAEETGITNNVEYDKVLFALPWTEKAHMQIITALTKNQYNSEENRIVLKNISRGFIHKLFNLAEVWWRDSVMYLPELAWIIHSNKKLKNERKNKPEDVSVASLLQQIIVEGPIKHHAIRLLRIPVIWLDLLQRSGGKNESR